MNRNRRGFTLVEMMIVLGVGAIILVGIASMLVNSQKGQQSVTSHADFNSLQGMVQTVLTSSNCASYLQNPVFNPPSIANGPIATPIQIPVVALNGVTLMNKAQPVNGWSYYLTITNIVDNSSAPTFTIQMALNGQRTGANEIGSGSRTSAVPFTFTITTDGSLGGGKTGKITSCGPQSEAFGAPVLIPLDASQTTGLRYAATDGFVIATSDYDYNVEGYVGTPPAAGSCAGLPGPLYPSANDLPYSDPPAPMQRIFENATRDKYGEGSVSGFMPVRKGDCWVIQDPSPGAHNAHPNTGWVWWVPAG